MSTQTELTAWKFVAPEVVFGPETRHHAGRYAKNFGLRSVLVVTDPGIIASGWATQVIASLEAAGVASVVFAQVTPNPRAEEVMAGAELYRQQLCNGIVAVGGGSAVDCAKGIGIVNSNRGHIVDFEGVDRVPRPGPPLICVPTTYSSADVSQFAVISDPTRQNKFEIISKALVPDVSLIDPCTTATMNPFVTGCTAIDALAHGIEAYVSTSHTPLTDLCALDAIRLVSHSLPRVMSDPSDREARRELMLGSLQAGLAFSNASLGLVHAMAHALGGCFDFVHGECVAMVLAEGIEFNSPVVPDRYRRIGEAMGLDLSASSVAQQRASIVDEVRRLRHVAGLKRTLADAGVRQADVEPLAKRAMADLCIVTNPRRPEAVDIEEAFERAF